MQFTVICKLSSRQCNPCNSKFILPHIRPYFTLCHLRGKLGNVCNFESILKTSFLWGDAIRPAMWSYFILGQIWVANSGVRFSFASKKTEKKNPQALFVMKVLIFFKEPFYKLPDNSMTFDG